MSISVHISEHGSLCSSECKKKTTRFCFEERLHVAFQMVISVHPKTDTTQFLRVVAAGSISSGHARRGPPCLGGARRRGARRGHACSVDLVRSHLFFFLFLNFDEIVNFLASLLI